MAHVVTSKCVGCKFTDCVVVCPVACFYELDGQLVIHPEECIDCMACVDECPVHAIYAADDVPAEFQADIEFNATEAQRGAGVGPGCDRDEKGSLADRRPKESRIGLLSSSSVASALGLTNSLSG